MRHHPYANAPTFWTKGVLLSLALLLCACGGSRLSTRIDDNKSLFPIEQYDQHVATAISPTASQYRTPVMSSGIQGDLLQKFRDHVFGITQEGMSPWNPAHVRAWLRRSGDSSIAAIEQRYLDQYTAADAHVFAHNFREQSATWRQDLQRNTAIQQFSGSSTYRDDNRAISVMETDVRVLPASTPAFSDPTAPGQGYPFDNLQNSSLRPATPLYILGSSRDQEWYLVLAPEVMGWIRSDSVARTDKDFIDHWRQMVQEALGAIIDEPVPVIDHQHHFRFTARTGTVLPITRHKDHRIEVMVPVRDEDGQAHIHEATLHDEQMAPMPLAATPENFARLISNKIGKPYGWGSLYADNDCSAEIRTLLAPFGIFLPRNSYDQSESGRKTDLSKLSAKERITYLMQRGTPFTTLVYIKGHVMLYIGNTTINGRKVPLTYQNIWGLRPQDNSRRSIIGQSVIFPLLETYPEDPSLRSLAGTDTFILTDLRYPD